MEEGDFKMAIMDAIGKQELLKARYDAISEMKRTFVFANAGKLLGGYVTISVEFFGDNKLFKLDNDES